MEFYLANSHSHQNIFIKRNNINIRQIVLFECMSIRLEKCLYRNI